MSNAAYVREVLLECPHIVAGPFDMAIDFLEPYPMRYSIEGEPVAPVVRQYLGGDTLRRFSFALCARLDVDSDDARAGNAKHYEDLSLWLEGQTRARRLPPMAGGATARQMLAVGAPYLSERDGDNSTAVYMMQIELTYYQKAREQPI